MDIDLNLFSTCRDREAALPPDRDPFRRPCACPMCQSKTANLKPRTPRPRPHPPTWTRWSPVPPLRPPQRPPSSTPRLTPTLPRVQRSPLPVRSLACGAASGKKALLIQCSFSTLLLLLLTLVSTVNVLSRYKLFDSGHHYCILDPLHI